MGDFLVEESGMARVDIQVAAGQYSDEELRSLHEWLCDETSIGPGRVKYDGIDTGPQQMGAVSDTLIVVLGSGGAGAVLARSVDTWLRQRTTDVKLKITQKGRSLEVSAGKVRNVDRFIESIDRLLDGGR
jgi:hypothetical protein